MFGPSRIRRCSPALTTTVAHACMLAAALAVCLVGCGSSPASAYLDNRAAGMPSAAERIGVRCEKVDTSEDCIAGNLDAGDFYEVSFPPHCGGNGVLAGVVAGDPKLLDTLPVTGSNARVTAHLAKGQLACVQAIARVQSSPPSFYYVAPISSEMCQGREICHRFGARPVATEAGGSAQSCEIDTQGELVGDCARGWIDADAVETTIDSQTSRPR